MLALILTLVGILAVFFLFVCFYFLFGLIGFFARRGPGLERDRAALAHE